MIRVESLARRYAASRTARDPVEALRGISFDAPDGAVTAILGPNGAGKTTALRILSGLESADAGQVIVGGDTAMPLSSRIGFFTEGCGLYGRLTGLENIQYYGRLHGMLDAAIDTRISVLDQALALAGLLGQRAESYSQGERLRVALARAMVHDPQHLILDEPTNGLDLASVRRLRAFLRHVVSAEGGSRCVLYSSHVMDEVARLADHVVVVSAGRVRAMGSVQEIIRQTGAPDFETAFVQLAFGETA